MRTLLSTTILFLAVVQCFANDAIVWSNDINVRTSSASALVASGKPLVILALDDFTLATFSKAVNAYSTDAEKTDSALVSAIRSAKYQTSEIIDSLSVPATAKIIREATWTGLNEAFNAISPESDYIGILVDASALKAVRVKRVSINDESSNDGFDASNEGGAVPVVVPRYGENGEKAFDTKNGPSCLLYFENITVVVLAKNTIGNGQKAFTVVLGSKEDSYKYSYSCDNVKDFNTSKPFSFTINYKVNGDYIAVGNKPAVTVPPQTFTINLAFNVNDGFHLANARVSGLKVEPGLEQDFLEEPASVEGNAIYPKAVPFRAYFGYNYACGQSQAIFFNSSVPNVLVGVGFNNIQIQGSGIKQPNADTKVPQFTFATADCVGTFTSGSWMGIVVAITLATIFLFGFLMLNSVQTMDRFDDPKQKQLVINYKE